MPRKKNHFNRSYFLLFPAFLISFLVTISCTNQSVKQDNVDAHLFDSLQHMPENALKDLHVAKGLEIQTFATEPVLKNPTNIDIDERGRVWVTEAFNYRNAQNGNPINSKGDRIIILEDTNHDGKADTTKVFYQGTEINAPLGIAVLGNKVIISQSPYVWAFFDDDGDDRADRKEIMFQGIEGEDHDHGIHAFVFAADGKLYFNFGNSCKTLRDKNNKVILDQDGDPIDQKKYKQGMVFRCDIDGSNVECLGYNFRNPYELAVDSYGTMWQSDNDDDGNRGVRINYVMEYGNYGYTNELTGAGWQNSRTNMEDSIPLQHWHLNDPGVVPNLLQTGAGSPTGMIVYEGQLLPKQFRDQLLHADAGPNVVRSYSITPRNAGYEAKVLNVLNNDKDQWFRPVDVCVAPDGSVFIADWYDPVVGGHEAGDQERGRIYRIAPPKTEYTIPQYSYSSPQGAANALKNPNLAVRYHAWNELQKMNRQAIPELEKLWTSDVNPRMRARALWALVKLPASNSIKYINQAIRDSDPSLRMTGIRAARELKLNVTGVVKQLVNDKSPEVRRECAIALRHNKSPEAADLWAALANQHNGQDRWYVEALGIGADKQWDRFFAAYIKKNNNKLSTTAQQDIAWRARTDLAVPYIAQFAQNQSVDLKSRLRYFRAFDFNGGPAKSKYLLAMLKNGSSADVEFHKLVLKHLDLKTVANSQLAQKRLKEVLRLVAGTSEFVELVNKYEVRSENTQLLKLALQKQEGNVGSDAAGSLLKLGGKGLVYEVINKQDTARSENLLRSISRVGSKESLDLLQSIAFSASYPMHTKKLAAEMIGKSWAGEEKVLELLRNNKVPAALIPPLVAGVNQAWRKPVRDEAASYLPNTQKEMVDKKAPTIKELMAMNTNSANGKAVFQKSCALCHQIANQGSDFGPKLTEIGSKLPKEGLLEAIVHPSSGISFGYEGWQINMKDGSSQTGIIASKTETDIDIKLPGGIKQEIKTAEVKSIKEMKESMMPEGLHQSMTRQELADVIEYLATLKKTR